MAVELGRVMHIETPTMLHGTVPNDECVTTHTSRNNAHNDETGCPNVGGGRGIAATTSAVPHYTIDTVHHAPISNHLKSIVIADPTAPSGYRFNVNFERVQMVDKYVTQDSSMPASVPSVDEISRDDTEHFLLWFEKVANVDDMYSAYGNEKNWDAWVTAIHAEFSERCNDLLYK